jgi:hypothetical protein
MLENKKKIFEIFSYYNHIVQAYRTEQWWPILEAILPAALK